jgi:hypothetical protein
MVTFTTTTTPVSTTTYTAVATAYVPVKTYAICDTQSSRNYASAAAGFGIDTPEFDDSYYYNDGLNFFTASAASPAACCGLCADLPYCAASAFDANYSPGSQCYLAMRADHVVEPQGYYSFGANIGARDPAGSEWVVMNGNMAFYNYIDTSLSCYQTRLLLSGVFQSSHYLKDHGDLGVLSIASTGTTGSTIFSLLNVGAAGAFNIGDGSLLLASTAPGFDSPLVMATAAEISGNGYTALSCRLQGDSYQVSCTAAAGANTFYYCIGTSALYLAIPANPPSYCTATQVYAYTTC